MSQPVLHRVYDRQELIADGAVHGLALFAAFAAGGWLLVSAVVSGQPHIYALFIYLTGLLCMLGFSTAYNMMPVSDLKWMLRRCDHAAIYMMIASTYTPLLVRLNDAHLAIALAFLVWIGALAGAAVKIILPARFDRLAILLYLALGWVGIAVFGDFMAVLPATSISLILAGGIIYTAGVPVYLANHLRFHDAVWHLFVAAAAACHFLAIALLYV